MGDESTSPELSSGPFLVGRVLKSTATGAVATLLFVVISLNLSIESGRFPR